MLKRIQISNPNPTAALALAIQRAAIPASFQRELYNRLNNNLNLVDRKKWAAQISGLFELDHRGRTLGGALANTNDAYARLDYIEDKPGFYFVLNLHAVTTTPYAGEQRAKGLDNPLADPQLRDNLPYFNRSASQLFDRLGSVSALAQYKVSVSDLAANRPLALVKLKPLGGRQTFHLRLLYPIRLTVEDPTLGLVDLSTI